ncbi:MAG: sporulation initiation factor Spo0A C-terminal domain-containing protein [Oscillospiraceae bacterium]|nr:sporulation initiation factor Spo0A C-terminal domain-containing protein [Oscillospiraceae bacterium]
MDDNDCSHREYIIITRILHYIGVPAQIVGFKFLREAIYLAVCDPANIHRIMKNVYPAVAAHFNSTPSKVERGIRHAIDIVWQSEYIGKLVSDAGSPVYGLKLKPTNAQLIATVADWIYLHPEGGAFGKGCIFSYGD